MRGGAAAGVAPTGAGTRRARLEQEQRRRGERRHGDDRHGAPVLPVGGAHAHAGRPVSRHGVVRDRTPGIASAGERQSAPDETMYGQTIASVALCEAYAMTHDARGSCAASSRSSLLMRRSPSERRVGGEDQRAGLAGDGDGGECALRGREDIEYYVRRVWCGWDGRDAGAPGRYAYHAGRRRARR